MKRVQLFIFIAIALLIAFSITSCKPPQKTDYDELNLTIPKDYPIEILGAKIEKCPQKVVSISPLITDIILSLGSDSQLIGISEDVSPQTLTKLPRVGNIYNPDIDKIIELNADLIISSLPLSPEDQMKIDEQKIPMIIMDGAFNWNLLSELYQNVGIAMSGKYAGSENAKNTIDHMNRSMESIKNKVKKEPPLSALLILSYGEVAAPVNSVEGYLLQTAGGKNVANGQIQFRFEKKDVIASGAEYIFCSKDDIKEIIDDKDLAVLPAVKNKRIFAVDIPAIQRQGDSMVEITEQMAKLMHPAVFETLTTVQATTKQL